MPRATSRAFRAAAFALAIAAATASSAQQPATGSPALTSSVHVQGYVPRTAAERRDEAMYSEVRRIARAIKDSYNRRDVHAAAAYDARDFYGYFGGMVNAFGPAGDEQAMKAMLARGIEWQGAPGDVTLVGKGDVAVFETNYYFVFHGADGKVIRREYGHWLAIFARQRDGSMKRWRSAMTPSPEPIYPAPVPVPPRPPRP